jgi:DNA-binding NtrC family response regulator
MPALLEGCAFERLEKMSEIMQRILIVDDDSNLRFMLSEAFRKTDDEFQVVTAINGEDALTKFEENGFDLVITDYKMPCKNGVELVEAIRGTLDDSVPVIMITAFASDELRSDNERLKVFCCLNKPLKIGEIRQAAYDALESRPPPVEEKK